MFTVVGKGFGVYGYVPALLELEQEVILPIDYKSIFESRSDIYPYISKIEWVDDLDSCFLASDAAILAVKPIEQAGIVLKALNYNNIKSLILEKPLTESPTTSKTLLNKLLGSHLKAFRINYSFLYCDWYSKLKLAVLEDNNDEICITWTFRAHHFQNNLDTWKKDHDLGGGPIRFYGIHLIAVLASLGFSSVSESSFFSFQDWRACFSNGSKTRIYAKVLSNCDHNEFSIVNKKTNGAILLNNPFEEIKYLSSLVDVRNQLTAKVISSLDNENDTFYDLYKKVLDLWSSSEVDLEIKS